MTMRRPENPNAKQQLLTARGAADTKGATLADFEEFGRVCLPGDVEEPIFPRALRQTFQSWIQELNCFSALKPLGVQPRQRAMLEGPPGTGKTSAGHYLAARLGVPLVVVEVPSLVAGYIGHTGIKIGNLFQLARRMDVALFLDEIDAVASARGAANSSKDQDNQVIALLQMIDRHPGLLFAATNRADTLDPAIWRRFQLQIHVGMPDDEAGFALVKRYLLPLEVDDEGVQVIWAALAGLPPAVIKEVLEGVRRDFVMAPRLNLPVGAAETFDRLRLSIKPADGAEEPMLWADPETTLDALAGIAWPPVLRKAA